MTSLSSQLQTLKSSVAKQLTVERKHVSLLFDKSQASQLDRETVYKIGCTGLDQLRKIDGVFQDDCQFFAESSLSFQRSLITAAENDALSVLIKHFIMKLSPYLQHFACQQVLEWMLYKYQIYSFEAEFVIAAFLPFHDTNIYARLLSILDYSFEKSRDWGFLEQHAKLKSPVPFKTLVKRASTGTHSLLTCISKHIEHSIKLLGQQFIEVRSSLLFTLFAKLSVSVVCSKTVDDGLVAKFLPPIISGLRSSSPSYRSAAFMIICQMSINTKLSSSTVISLIKIILMKTNKEFLKDSLSTIAVICQQQEVTEFSSKGVQKLLRRDFIDEVWLEICLLQKSTDLTGFLDAIWSTLICVYTNELVPEGEKAIAVNGLVATGNCDALTPAQASCYIGKFLDALSRDFVIPPCIQDNIHALCIRFSDAWNEIHQEWSIRDMVVLSKFVELCSLRNSVMQSCEHVSNNKHRRCSSQRSNIGDSELFVIPLVRTPIAKNRRVVNRAIEMAELSEFSKKKQFAGDPLTKSLQWMKENDIENLTWALEEINERSAYFSKVDSDEFEKFIAALIKFMQKQPGSLRRDLVKITLSKACFSEVLVENLLRRHSSSESETNTKKRKTCERGRRIWSIAQEFDEESKEFYEFRERLALEVLLISQNVTPNAVIFTLLFERLQEVEAVDKEYHILQLILSLLLKFLNEPGRYKVSSSDIQMDCIVETMRNTSSHHILRDCLRVLTSAVKINPAAVTSHVMSVFTFMGNGILRKDNELTLTTIEKTIESLFTAIMACDANNKDQVALRLIDVSRIFASSASDVPAHRRGRIAKAIGSAVGLNFVWLIVAVMMDGYCTKWQRSSSDQLKKGVAADQECFEDIALELVLNLEPVEQLYVVLDIIQYVIRVGGDMPKDIGLIDTKLFDRSKHTIPRLRHFRFVLIGLIVKILTTRSLYEKLAKCCDEEIYTHLTSIGKRLMVASVELDEFAHEENDRVSSLQDHGAIRYWVALQARSEAVAEKLRYLLPGGVSSALITDVLSDENTNLKMKQKTLQLANAKLMHDGFFYSESGINDSHLIRMASTLNQWIKPARSSKDEVYLCQNSTFTLKLIAKRLSKQDNSTVLTETMRRMYMNELFRVAQWRTIDEALTGNVLILAGELIRSHDMKSTLLSCESLIKCCLEILKDCMHNHKMNDESERPFESKFVRVRQQSLSGRKLGSDSFLVAALTCLQRILDRFSPFITTELGGVLVVYCKLVGRYGDPYTGPLLNPVQQNAVPFKASAHYRLSLIRSALVQIELRNMIAHFAYAAETLAAEEKPLSAMLSLISNYFVMKNRTVIVNSRLDLLDTVFLPAFSFRSRHRSPENFEIIERVERRIVETLLKMVDVLTEVENRAVISKMVSWAEEGISPLSNHETRLRLVSLFYFANIFYTSFNSVALPYFGKIMEIVPKVLRGCNRSLTNNLLLSGKRDTVEALEADLLLKHAIDFVAYCARHKDYFTRDRVDCVTDSLIEELLNTKVAGHNVRCERHLVEAFYRICDASVDSFPDILNKILLKTRNNRPKIRFRTLMVLEKLFEKIGDGVAPYLPLILPFLSELLEDENKNVEEQCERVLEVLRKTFGENIAEGYA